MLKLKSSLLYVNFVYVKWTDALSESRNSSLVTDIAYRSVKRECELLLQSAVGITHVLRSVLSFSHKDLGVTQSLHGNVYKVANYKGQVTMCNSTRRPAGSVCLHKTIQSNLSVRSCNLKIVNKPPRFWILVLYGIPNRG